MARVRPHAGGGDKMTAEKEMSVITDNASFDVKSNDGSTEPHTLGIGTKVLIDPDYPTSGGFATAKGASGSKDKNGNSIEGKYGTIVRNYFSK